MKTVVFSHSVWIVGMSRSGKTARLVEQFARWMQDENCDQESFYTKKSRVKSDDRLPKRVYPYQKEGAVLILAANDDNRRELADRIVTATRGQYPVRCKTPLGFFQDEVILFWPLLVQSLKLKAQFPVRLRPETEQELATRLWRPQLDEEILRRAGTNEYRLVRRILDLLQLAAYSGTPVEDIGRVLAVALAPEDSAINLEPEFLSALLLDWRNWCLERGLLSYGIITELYNQYLLTDPNYQQRLRQRYQGVLADDVQDYPAVARHLFELLLDDGAVGAFTYNPDGVVRLGLGADPNYMQELSAYCQQETLTGLPDNSLSERLTTPMLEILTEPMTLLSLPEVVQSIQATSRAQLLRQTAEVIVQAIKQEQVEPDQVAVIAPGLDAIARYTLTEILIKQGIAVESLNDQRPLIASPVIRALLTVLALVYPGLGRLVDRDAVAEMLVVLSRGDGEMGRTGDGEKDFAPSTHQSKIDPVRAGLIADYCFQPHPEYPNLLPVTAFDRWDRLGYAATTAYSEILKWLEEQRSQQELRLIPSPISLLDRAIQRFLWDGSNLAYDQLAALRELLETTQHYWEIDTRLRQIPQAEDVGKNKTSQLTLTASSPQATIAEFIQLLQRGTITANPYPMRPMGAAAKAVTLATIFQYRSSRRSHRWHFWLDASSPLWAKGGAATLFGAPFFLRERLGEPWTAEDEQLAEEQRLRRILADLLSRVSQTVYLCHSDLAVNGQEQLGPLLPLVNACVAVVSESVVT
ncbi:recombinase family protein [Fischerella sp. JS2]|uniref:recombinase family protein n=1 Tax=Fischerella sp. JS2 TaxID=2597771 RepID=UPI0028EF9033|nr:recombinase family protein [Fischerella sp. JS2]